MICKGLSVYSDGGSVKMSCVNDSDDHIKLTMDNLSDYITVYKINKNLSDRGKDSYGKLFKGKHKGDLSLVDNDEEIINLYLSLIHI